MILSTDTTVVERSGALQEHSFTIKATASAFQILSSGLYSDKILAIVRELSANAYDSHVAAGNQHIPIEVKLPSSFDPTFYVKDFGIGLSHDQVISLYSTYFESTKQDSNDFIGALGLGSKSPFSYTTAFNVESRYDGICHMYSCFINETQLPSIVKLSEAPMSPDDRNGMTITISTKPDDYVRFETAAKKTFMYYDPLPKIVGKPSFSPYKLNHSVKGTNWKIRHSEYQAYMKGPHVVQGFITYPIDGTAIATHGLSANAQALIGTSIDFTVPIGQVEVAASREALSYSKQTTSNIADIFEQAATEIYDSFQTEFDKCTSMWEVGLLYEELKTSQSEEFGVLFERLHTAQPFLWNGQKVEQKVVIDMGDVEYTQVQQLSVINGGARVSCNRDWKPNKNYGDWEVPVSKRVHVIVDPTCVATREVCRRYINSLNVPKVILIVIKPISKKCTNQEELDYVLNNIGIGVYVLASDLIDGTDTKPRTRSTKREKSERLMWTPVDTSNYNRYNEVKVGKNFWTLDSIDVGAGGFYVPVSRYTPYHDNSPYPNFKDVVRFGKLLGLVPQSASIYGLPLAEVANLSPNTNWINVVDHINTKFKELLEDEHGEIQAGFLADELQRSFCSQTLDTLLCCHSKFAKIVADGEFKTCWDSIVNTTNLSQKYNRDNLVRLANLFKITIDSPTSRNSVYVEWQELSLRYPMLSFVNGAGLRTEDEMKLLIQYINSIDNPAIDI